MNVVEDEIHFLMTCPKYDHMRDAMIQKALSVEEDFRDWNIQEKALFLLSDIKVARTVIKTVNHMFLERKSALFK